MLIRPRRALTLVEVLVLLAIVGVLIGLAVPALQSMRELSRRKTCEQNLMRISLAMANYLTRHNHYPSGTINDDGPIKSLPQGYHHNWIEGLLPLLDAEEIYERIDRSVSVYAPANDPVRTLMIPPLRCPSAEQTRDYTTCYAGISSAIETPIDADNNGTFFLNTYLRDADIEDGLSHTLFVGEKLSRFEDLGWLSGTRSSLRNTGHPINAHRRQVRGPQSSAELRDPLFVGGLGSDHPDGAYLMMGSGEVEFRNEAMDMKLLQQMASRADDPAPEITIVAPDVLDDPVGEQDSGDSATATESPRAAGE